MPLIRLSIILFNSFALLLRFISSSVISVISVDIINLFCILSMSVVNYFFSSSSFLFLDANLIVVFLIVPLIISHNVLGFASLLTSTVSEILVLYYVGN